MGITQGVVIALTIATVAGPKEFAGSIVAVNTD
jgi:hypothetical protein